MNHDGLAAPETKSVQSRPNNKCATKPVPEPKPQHLRPPPPQQSGRAPPQNRNPQGDPAQGKAALRNAQLPAGSTIAAVTLADAVAALAGARALGEHPALGGEVRLHPVGRFGPYLSHNGLYAAMPKARRLRRGRLAGAGPGREGRTYSGRTAARLLQLLHGRAARG
jgi:hypothetical protein